MALSPAVKKNEACTMHGSFKEKGTFFSISKFLNLHAILCYLG